jgi:hypothetical protein
VAPLGDWAACATSAAISSSRTVVSTVRSGYKIRNKLQSNSGPGSFQCCCGEKSSLRLGFLRSGRPVPLRPRKARYLKVPHVLRRRPISRYPAQTFLFGPAHTSNTPRYCGSNPQIVSQTTCRMGRPENFCRANLRSFSFNGRKKERIFREELSVHLPEWERDLPQCPLSGAAPWLVPSYLLQF